MFGLAGYAVLAVGIGASLGFLANPSPTDQQKLYALAVLVIAPLVIYPIRRYLTPGPAASYNMSGLFLRGAAIIVGWTLLLAVTQSAITFSLPRLSSLIGGLAFGLALWGLWMERHPTVPGAKIAVMLLYSACAITAIGTLFAHLPPSAFWSVSAVVPAWQARQLVQRKELAAAFRLLNASIQVFVWILFVSLLAPVLLQLR